MTPPVAPPALSKYAFQPKLGDRDLFPTLDALVYTNHAAISPPSVAVRHAILAIVDDYAKRGFEAFPTWNAQRARLKEKLARLIGAPSAADIALTQNTSRGISDVALCLPWKPGDRVIVFEGEFPANVTPWQRAAELHHLEIRMLPVQAWLDDQEQALVALREALAQGARLCAVSAVQFSSGWAMPLREIVAACHEAGAQVLVDAVQACGVVPIDVGALGVDYLACGAHKWMLGVEGAGFLYARPEHAAAMQRNVAGWLSHEDGLGFLMHGPNLLRYDRPIRKTIDFLEGGNLSATAFAALEASLDLLLALEPKNIHEHVNAYHDRLEPILVERGFTSLRAADPARRSGILSVLAPAGVDVVALHAALGRCGVACSIPDGRLRFSPHYSNALDEVEQLELAIPQALTSL